MRPSVTIGREGVSEAVLTAIDEAHLASELIKLRVLDTCAQDRHGIAEELQQHSGSEVVQLLGRTILLYRRDPDEPQIELPSERRPSS